MSAGGLHLDDSVRTELLGLGILTMFLSPERDTKMSTIISQILEKPGNNTLLHEVSFVMKEKGSNQSALLGLGVLSAYIKSEDGYVASQPWVQAFIIVAITAVFIALRLYAKWFVSRNIKAADYLIVLAWTSTLVYCILTYIHEVNYKVCHHVWDFTWNEYSESLFFLLILEVIFMVVTFLIKASVMLFYWDLVPRLDGTSFRFFHNSILGAGVFVLAASVTAIFTVIFQCKPVQYWQNPLAAKCLPRVPLWTSISTLIATTDFLVLILPISVVWKLNLRRREKIIVTCLFGLGTLSCVAAIPRIIITANFVNDPDITFKSCDITIWVLLEFCLAIIAACIPATKALVMQYAPRILGSRTRSRATSGSRSDNRMPSRMRGRGSASDSQRDMIEELEMKEEEQVRIEVGKVVTIERDNKPTLEMDRTRKEERILGLRAPGATAAYVPGYR